MSSVHNLRVIRRELGDELIGRAVNGAVVSDRTFVLGDHADPVIYVDKDGVWEYALTPAPEKELKREAEALAFDLTFDPSMLCAICVAGLYPPNLRWGVKAYGPDKRLIDTREIEITPKWARELIERGGEIRTPDNNILPLYAATLYRGTPLCQYDITPALRGLSGYKF